MIQGKSRMRETRPYGSVRGATRKNGPYRDLQVSWLGREQARSLQELSHCLSSSVATVSRADPSSPGQFLLKPVVGFLFLAALEVANLGGCEWTAESRHPLLPFLLADDRQTFDAAEMVEGELGVLP